MRYHSAGVVSLDGANGPMLKLAEIRFVKVGYSKFSIGLKIANL